MNKRLIDGEIWLDWLQSSISSIKNHPISPITIINFSKSIYACAVGVKFIGGKELLFCSGSLIGPC